MESLEIRVWSASGLKDLNTIGTMDPYVTVSLSNDPRSRQKTEVHTDGGKNPNWKGKPMRFQVNEDLFKKQNVTLVFKVMAEKPFGDKEVGEVIVPINELFQGNPQTEKSLSYSVSTPSGKPKGTLNFSYKVVKNVSESNVAGGCGSMAVGPGPSSYSPGPYAPPNPQPQYRAAAPYPPQPQQYQPPPPGYYPPPQHGYPTQQEYGYPAGAPPPLGAYAYPYGGAPPPPGPYAYPHAQGYPSGPGNNQHQMKHGGKKPKSKTGGLLGLGALGMGAGLVGGMLLGGMASDLGDMASGFGDVASGLGDIAGGAVGDVADYGGAAYETAGTYFTDVSDSMSTLGSIG